MARNTRLVVKDLLNSNERESVDAFLSKLRQTLGEDLMQATLFGSKARGDSEQYSDIDILVIVNDENREIRNEIITLASRISLDFDVLLSPRVIGRERWEQMGAEHFTLYGNVSREGKVLFEK